METNNNTTTELEMLKQQVAALTGMLGLVKASTDGEKEIPFVSLSQSVVNLATEGDGKGDIFTFYEFGEVQLIPSSIAKALIRKNKKFIKDGIVYIDDADFVKKEGLSYIYNNLIDKDTMLGLLKASRKQFENTFSRITDVQKHTVANLVSTKITNGEEVDMNIIQIINQGLKIDLIEEIESVKLLKENKEK